MITWTDIGCEPAQHVSPDHDGPEHVYNGEAGRGSLHLVGTRGHLTLGLLDDDRDGLHVGRPAVLSRAVVGAE